MSVEPGYLSCIGKIQVIFNNILLYGLCRNCKAVLHFSVLHNSEQGIQTAKKLSMCIKRSAKLANDSPLRFINEGMFHNLLYFN